MPFWMNIYLRRLCYCWYIHICVLEPNIWHVKMLARRQTYMATHIRPALFTRHILSTTTDDMPFRWSLHLAQYSSMCTFSLILHVSCPMSWRSWYSTMYVECCSYEVVPASVCPTILAVSKSVSFVDINPASLQFCPSVPEVPCLSSCINLHFPYDFLETSVHAGHS